ncbi:MAG: 4a-hydroxytetrahydrobiopterin dehydratase [Rickettsiales bacterium]|nr:4a-hydroxytetrahydrobiopterin dehydratase [Rickettsiales bacterium]
MSLAEKHCVPCMDSAEEPLDSQSAQRLLAAMSGWHLSEDSKSISREWSFKNFKYALDFVNEVSVIAEAENHHPDISFGWGYVRISFTTHSINGLHENDFVMAAKINLLGQRETL